MSQHVAESVLEILALAEAREAMGFGKDALRPQIEFDLRDRSFSWMTDTATASHAENILPTAASQAAGLPDVEPYSNDVDVPSRTGTSERGDDQVPSLPRATRGPQKDQGIPH